MLNDTNLGSALHNVRVLDLSRVLAGPWATQLLADLGADVIKIERPGRGDDTRSWGPPWFGDDNDPANKTSSYYTCANRNKRSLSIDMSKPAGQKLIRQLAKQSDVLVENFKFGGLKKYGLDYDSLKELNPRLIYCSITGFGHTGPYANRAGYDFLIQGMGGLMSITGRPDNEPGGGPIKVGVALTDILTGLYAANAVQAALLARSHTGRGQHIDLALLDVQVACMANQAAAYMATGQSPQRMGNAHPSVVPYQDFPTADGHMILAIGNDDQFKRFCDNSGKPELGQDPRFITNKDRVANRDALIPLMSEITKTKKTAEWIKKFESCSVPCGPINSLSQVFEDEQVQARGIQIKMDHNGLGELPLLANPMRFSDTPVSYRMAPPKLGEHTNSILQEVLGLDDAIIEKLKKQDVI